MLLLNGARHTLLMGEQMLLGLPLWWGSPPLIFHLSRLLTHDFICLASAVKTQPKANSGGGGISSREQPKGNPLGCLLKVCGDAATLFPLP